MKERVSSVPIGKGGPSSIEMGEVVSSPSREGRQSSLSIEGGRPSSIGIGECVSYPQREGRLSLLNEERVSILSKIRRQTPSL